MRRPRPSRCNREPTKVRRQTKCKSHAIEEGNCVNSYLRNAISAAACAAILLAPLAVRAQTAKSNPATGQQTSETAPAPGMLPGTADSINAGSFHRASLRNLRAEIKTLQLPASRTAAQTCHSDGSACSDDSECCNSCKGGSCCTETGNTCDSGSHCCSHIACGSDGKCP